MPERAYHHVEKDELIIRDRLAVDRTVLANERTLLAYIRTALALVVAGATLLQFFSASWAYLAWAFILVAPVMMLVGVKRFIQVRKDLRPLR